MSIKGYNENAPLPTPLVDKMAARARRMHNYLWHEVRDNWLTYPKDVQEELRKAGWEPPRPAWDASGNPLLDNNSGEDFLYMQRQAIRYANKILAQANDPDYPRVEGWLEIPAPDNSDFPVPPLWFDPAEFPVIMRFTTRSKTDLTYEKYLKPWEAMFTEPGFLKSISLGTFGSLLHATVHDTVRHRWAAVPGGKRPEPSAEVTTIPVDWDVSQYNYLGDTYSMQVNPIYWKFCGWLDERIDNWKVVHGVFGNDFWKGTWTGKLPAAPEGAPAGLHERLEDPDVANQHAKEVEQLLLTIAKSIAPGEASS